jgi:hypothetical protein
VSRGSGSGLDRARCIADRQVRTAVRVENLEHVSPWYLDRARTALKSLIGKVQRESGLGCSVN